MRKYLLFLIIGGAFVSGVFSQSIQALLEPEYAARLREDGDSVAETQLKSANLKLLPKHEELRRFVAAAASSLEPNLAVETLYLYKKPAPLAQPSKAQSLAQAGGWTDAQRTALFNQTLGISTLAGIQYFSASRGVMRTFYESSVVIDNPDKKNPLPDPFFDQLPQSFTLYARQKDLTFGDNIYRYDFETSAGAFFFTQENMTAMTYGIITAVGKNKLRSVFAVIDCGDSLLIYAVSMAKAAFVFGMGERIGNSFGNRAEAVLKWFTGRANGVFAAE